MSSSGPVCVRIAPSPTGDPHVGTAYIALFNWMFARKHGGRFILRIEDTDQKRYNPDSERQIMEALRWLGLSWDEGPDCGGPNGPYRQSERTGLYQDHARHLLERGHAYRCFCDAQRLNKVRQQRAKEKIFGGYDRACRALSEAEISERLDAGTPFTVRLKAPLEGDLAFKDVIRGVVRWPNAEVDDQILLKSDGFPTYHLANVVDDHLMGVTHVIRAEEWISSTSKHLLLYQGFGWEAPVFAHMPLLRNADRSKISKRKNPCSLLYYQDLGVLPRAMLNFLALQGWSMPRQAREREEDLEFFTREEMLEHFDLDRVSKGAPVFDLAKLRAINGKHIRALAPADFEREIRAHLDRWLPRMLPFLQTRMEVFNEWLAYAGFLFEDRLDYSVVDLGGGKTEPHSLAQALLSLADALETVQPWTAEAIEQAIFAWAESRELPRKRLFGAVRLAITGTDRSPPLHQSIAALNRFMACSRLRDAAARLNGEHLPLPALAAVAETLDRGVEALLSDIEARLSAAGMLDEKKLAKQKKARQDLTRVLCKSTAALCGPYLAGAVTAPPAAAPVPAADAATRSERADKGAEEER